MPRPFDDPSQRILRTLQHVFDGRDRRLSAYSQVKRVEGRNPDGTINIRPLDGECVQRSNICNAYEGQLIKVPCGNGFSNLGAAGTAIARFSVAVGAMWVESLDPYLFGRGGSYTVTVIGGGFREISEFEFLVPGTDTINEDITVVSATYMSDSEFTLEIEVAGDAVPSDVDDQENIVLAAIAFDNPGMAI